MQTTYASHGNLLHIQCEKHLSWVVATLKSVPESAKFPAKWHSAHDEVAGKRFQGYFRSSFHPAFLHNQRGFFRARKNSCRTCPFEVKCRKTFWLQARQALWSNCKRRGQGNRDFSCVSNMNCCFARYAAIITVWLLSIQAPSTP